MEVAPPAPEELPPVPPDLSVEREISLAEILQAVAKSKEDVISLLNRGDVSLPVQAVLSAMLDRFEYVEKNVQSFVYGNAVVASVERTLSTLPQYSDEKIAEIRRLRAEVEEMVAAFVALEKSRESAIDKNNRKIELLKKYGLEKWGGAAYGDMAAGTEFLRRHYGRWLDAGVFFKDDLRRIDHTLVDRLKNEVVRGKVLIDPLPTRDVRTNQEAEGILCASGERQVIAKAVVIQRGQQREMQRHRRRLQANRAP